MTAEESNSSNQVNPRITQLEEEIATLQAQFAGQDADAIVQRHIDLLHTYNEIKDATQALIAKYAVMTQNTVTAVHIELGLPTEEKK